MNDDGMDNEHDDQPTGISGPLGDDPGRHDARESRASRGGGGRAGGRGRGKSGGSGASDRSGGGSRRPSVSSGVAAALKKPAGRIGVAVAAVIILIIISTLLIQGCRRNQMENSYKSYMGAVTTIVTESGTEGDALQQVLQNQSGAKSQELQVQLRDLSNKAQGLVGQAQNLQPPDSLSAPNQSLVTTLQYRVTGLRALADSLPSVVDSKNRAYASATLASAMQRFLASDVIYQDSFVGPAKRALADADVTGVQVPDRQFFLGGIRADQASPTGAGQLIPGLQRTGGSALSGTDTTGTLRGTGLISVQALPQGVDLTAGSATEIQASDKLEWQVTIQNSGGATETNVLVRVTFAATASAKDAQTAEKSIPSIDAGQQQVVTFPGPKSPTFDKASVLKVEVVPVPGETRTDNNGAEYPVKIVF